MKNRLFHIIFLSFSLILAFIAFFFFFISDFEVIAYKDGVTKASIIFNYVSVFGGSHNVTRGNIVDGSFVFIGNENLILDFAFDYLTFIGLIVCLLTFIVMNINFNKKVFLLISTFLNSLSLIYLAFQVEYFLFVNSDRSEITDIFKVNGSYEIISYGLIAFLVIFAFIDLSNYIRVIYLFKRKVTIE